MKRLLIDGASVAWTALYAGKDEEFGKSVLVNGKKVYVNSAGYGYNNAMNMIAAAWERFGIAPINTIFVREGQNSRDFRCKTFDGYKGGKQTLTHPKEAYEQFNALTEALIDGLLSIGAMSVKQDGIEGDDVLAHLSQNLDGEKYILTGDGDMTVLCSDTVHVWRNDTLDGNPYGPFPNKYIAVYKALVGDTSDGYKGVEGFGKKAFLDLYCMFGDDGLEGMDEMLRLKTLHEIEEHVHMLPALKKILNNQEKAIESYKLAKLYPDAVDIFKFPMKWSIGYVKRKAEVTDDERIRKWAASHRLIHAGNFREALQFMRAQMMDTPYVTLDLETHVGEQSQEWLAQRTAKGGGVDVLGSEIVGCGLTFGNNMQYNYYVTVNHKEEPGVPNCSLDQLAQMLEVIPQRLITLAHNAAGFELPVLANAFQARWKNNGWRGLYPNMVDTRIAASYWDENRPTHGLKDLSRDLLGYTQTSYAEVTQGRTMHEMTALETFAYGIDDVVMTSALWNYFQAQMEIEKTIEAFYGLEQKPMYLSALGYLDGIRIDQERLYKLKDADEAAYAEARATVEAFLLERGWAGTVCPEITELDAKSIKLAYELFTGVPLATAVRTPEKLITLIELSEEPAAADLAVMLKAGDIPTINKVMGRLFDKSPKFDEASPKQVKTLLYETMGMPVRLRNRPTEAAKAKGEEEGTARTDEDAMMMALKTGDAGDFPHVLKALITLRSINTRRGLYWEPYPKAVHWKTGRIHPEMQQSRTNTRRWASSNPNIQQLDSSAGGVRTIILPHQRNAVIVSLDESGQEVRLAAAYSNDPNLLSCYKGTKEQLRDVHSIVACKIAGLTYDEFRAQLKSADPAVSGPASAIRSIAKTVLFASFYGAGAPKIAETLGIAVEEAETYIDTIYDQFAGLKAWKAETERIANMKGYVPVWGGTRRHLGPMLMSSNHYEKSKAARQGSNARIQSAGANQLKTVMTRIWDSDLLERFDMQWIAPVHDEIVFSVDAADAVEVVRVCHGFMVEQFLDNGVPSASSIGLGRNFGDLIEIGEVFDVEKIEHALVQLGCAKAA